MSDNIYSIVGLVFIAFGVYLLVTTIRDFYRLYQMTKRVK